MKTLSLISLLLIACISNDFAQASQAPALTPYFSAVVVSNIDQSVKWYQSVLGVKAAKTINDPRGSYFITILESPNSMLELLQLKGSVERNKILDGKAEGTEIQGHFKMGFKATDMDALLKHLAALKINVPQIWKDDATGKRNFLINDPDGNLVQFFE